MRDRHADPVEHLQHRLESRWPLFAAAAGKRGYRSILSMELLPADDAFTLLRRTSQEVSVKLVDLARTLTTRHTDLDRT